MLEETRLEELSRLRMDPTSFKFAASSFHRAGGKATVRQAIVTTLTDGEELLVAVKRLNYNTSMDKKRFVKEFASEVHIMADLKHDRIVKLIGFLDDLERGEAWIIVPWESNGNLTEFLASEDWEIPERISLIKDVFEGIEYLHTREPPIVHGDLKSMNILVGSACRAIITDFGSARTIDDRNPSSEDEHREGKLQRGPLPPIHIDSTGNQLTLTGPSFSLRWAPPEVVDGRRPVLASDVWSAGWVCWEIMTNKVPFQELAAEGLITLSVIEGKLPAPAQDKQLAHVIGLCNLMLECWEYVGKMRPTISRCCKEIRWMPSTPPSNRNDLISRVALLLELGYLHDVRHDLSKPLCFYKQALSLARSEGNEHGEARSLVLLGNVYCYQSQFDQAEESCKLAQGIYTQIGDDAGHARTLGVLGKVYRKRREYLRAEESLHLAQRLFTQSSNDVGQAQILFELGNVYHCQRKYVQAEESYKLAQEIHTRNGNLSGQAFSLGGLGRVYSKECRYVEAEESYKLAQEICTRIGDDKGRGQLLRLRGHLARHRRRHTEAAEFYRQAAAVSASIADSYGEKRCVYWLNVVSGQSKGSSETSSSLPTESQTGNSAVS